MSKTPTSTPITLVEIVRDHDFDSVVDRRAFYPGSPLQAPWVKQTKERELAREQAADPTFDAYSYSTREIRVELTWEEEDADEDAEPISDHQAEYDAQWGTENGGLVDRHMEER